MKQFTLSPTDWTEIVAPGGNDAVEIRSGDGQFHVSLGKPAEAEVRIIAKPPVSLQGGVWTRLEVSPGIAVFAKAITGDAVATVAPIDK